MITVNNAAQSKNKKQTNKQTNKQKTNKQTKQTKTNKQKPVNPSIIVGEVWSHFDVPHLMYLDLTLLFTHQ